MHDLSAATPISFVNVADRERARTYYRDVLGLKLRESDDFGDLFECGGGLMRMTALPDYKAGPHPVFGFEVSAIGEAMRILKGRGVAFITFEMEGFDQDGVWTAPTGAKLAWFQDSEGNSLLLSQS